MTLTAKLFFSHGEDFVFKSRSRAAGLGSVWSRKINLVLIVVVFVDSGYYVLLFFLANRIEMT